MNTYRHILTVCALVPCLMFVGAAQADSHKSHGKQEAYSALQRGEVISHLEALDIALREVPGKVLELEYESGPKYEVKILTPEGAVHEVKLDAYSGEIYKVKTKR